MTKIKSDMEGNVVRTTIIGILLLLTIALAACGRGEADTTAAVSDAAQTPRADRTPRAGLPDDAQMPVSMRLPVGTLMLEETDYAVTPAQAQELLPLWQMLGALQESGTASEVEVEAVLDQIQEGMTSEQLAAIEEMSQEDIQALFQELGMGRQGEPETGEAGGRARPDMGMMPPGAGQGPPGGVPGMGPGAFGDLSPEDQATAMAERGGMGMGFGRAFTDQVIELLETRAAES